MTDFYTQLWNVGLSLNSKTRHLLMRHVLIWNILGLKEKACMFINHLGTLNATSKQCFHQKTSHSLDSILLFIKIIYKAILACFSRLSSAFLYWFWYKLLKTSHLVDQCCLLDFTATFASNKELRSALLHFLLIIFSERLSLVLQATYLSLLFIFSHHCVPSNWNFGAVHSLLVSQLLMTPFAWVYDR